MANKEITAAGFTEKGLGYLEELLEEAEAEKYVDGKSVTLKYAEQLLDKAEAVNGVEGEPYDKLTSIHPGKAVMVENVKQAEHDPDYSPTTYQIVPSDEIDLEQNKITTEAPLISTLIDREATPGEVVEVELPSGETAQYRLLGVAILQENRQV